MTPEGKVKAWVKRILEAQATYYFMPAANGYGRAGIPDFVCCHYGHFLAIETKAGKGKTTALQEREHAAIRQRGGHVIVVTDDPATQEMLLILLAKLKEPQ